ncbi:hypothetical protein [Actinokineospora sp.]|uniref:hypothetical protein n=1 Tax=Actinokineospora sp. TaxID=1872133 RepID=UPI0040378D7D
MADLAVPEIGWFVNQYHREYGMSGYLEQAAGALNAASQQIPVEHVLAADNAPSAVVSATQQVGGQAGERFGQECLAIQSELQGIAGRLDALRQQMHTAAQQIAVGGGGL